MEGLEGWRAGGIGGPEHAHVLCRTDFKTSIMATAPSDEWVTAVDPEQIDSALSEAFGAKRLVAAHI